MIKDITRWFGLFGVSLMFLFCAVLVVGCGSDDPTPSFLQTSTATRPTTWTVPDYTQYEFRMSVQVQLGDTLSNFQSSDDLMCAMIDGEVRAVTAPLSTGGIIYYPLIIAGHGNEQVISLYYYCAQLQRIYTLLNWTNFNASAAPTGTSGLYRPCFTTEN